MVEEIKENKIQYKCERCNRIYDSKQEAEACEKRDKQERDLDNAVEFEIKPEHLKLLKNMYVSWDDCEFGAPCIDCKRPYGNSDVIDDIAEILGIKKCKLNVEDYNKEEAKEYEDINDYIQDLEWKEEVYDNLTKLHKEMKLVLQICLKTQSFKAGKYKREDRYGIEWKAV